MTGQTFSRYPKRLMEEMTEGGVEKEVDRVLDCSLAWLMRREERRVNKSESRMVMDHSKGVGIRNVWVIPLLGDWMVYSIQIHHRTIVIVVWRP